MNAELRASFCCVCFLLHCAHSLFCIFAGRVGQIPPGKRNIDSFFSDPTLLVPARIYEGQFPILVDLQTLSFQVIRLGEPLPNHSTLEEQQGLDV